MYFNDEEWDSIVVYLSVGGRRNEGEYGVYVFKRGPIVYEPLGLSCDLNSPVLVSTK